MERDVKRVRADRKRLADEVTSSRSGRTGNVIQPRMVRQVIKAAGLAPATAVFALLFVVATLVAAAVEPGIGNIGDAAWFYFTVVTTIGLGDFTCVTLVGRLTTVALSFYSVFYLAVITGAVVSYCSEVMQARQNESIAQFLDKLEQLPELSHEELVAISERIRRL